MAGLEFARHDSSLGTWTHGDWAPAAGEPLAGLIQRIWYFDGILSAPYERVFPDGTLELIVQLDRPHRPGLPGPQDPFPPLCVTGLRTTAEIVVAPPGRCRVLGVRLLPQGAFALLGVPLVEATSLTLDLRAVLDRASEELECRIREARDGAVAMRVAGEWTARRMARGPESDASVQRALALIVHDGGSRSMAALNSWQGRSRARFAAAFRERVGVSPKRFARIVRFDRSLHALAHGHAGFGEIALGAGYYDQAHFTSEFHAHAGLTPGAYRRSVRYPGANSAVAGPEQFFQDASLETG